MYKISIIKIYGMDLLTDWTWQNNKSEFKNWIMSIYFSDELKKTENEKKKWTEL